MLTRIVKVEDPAEEEVPELRLIYSEVYAPNRPDAQGEFMRPDTIMKAAHSFVKAGRMANIDKEHDNVLLEGVQVVESFVARKGDPDFIEGAWVVGIHVDNDAIWEAVKKGEVNGLSLEAFVEKDEQEVVVEIPGLITGKTSKSDSHEHVFYVTYDANGKFLGGVTDTVDGHRHSIVAGTVTEPHDGHSHRFSSVDGIEIVD